MLTRRKVVLGVVLLLCVAVLGYVMHTKGDQEGGGTAKDQPSADTTSVAKDTAKSTSFQVNVAVVLMVVLVCVFGVLPAVYLVYQNTIRRGVFETAEERKDRRIEDLLWPYRQANPGACYYTTTGELKGEDGKVLVKVDLKTGEKLQ